MNYRKTNLAALLLVSIAVSTTSSWAININPFGKKKAKQRSELLSKQLTPAQSALVDKAIGREKEIVKAVKDRAPLVETYIQNMRPDKDLIQIPESDQHFLGRVDFNKVIGNDTYESGPKPNARANAAAQGKLGFFKHSLSYITGLTNALHLQFRESGFVRMLILDSTGFDRQHYQFGFVRNEFIGTTPCAVFDVVPIEHGNILTGSKTTGRFFGRIWVETQGGNIVRFNGDLAGTQKTISEYYHFDSWRTNIQPNLWLPTSFYVEESDPKSDTNTVKFKAINHVWGYALKLPSQAAESTSMDVIGATDVSNDAPDISPLGAQRAWVQQAEDNVIDRLYQAGLLDAPSDFDKGVCEILASNMLINNNITPSRPIRCRTLLTEPLEMLAVGNTIILSKGLIDTMGVPTSDGLQIQGNLNAVIAFELAHIIVGHRLDTKYAFNDRLLFPDTSAFQRIPMHHTDADNAEAAKKAIELLSVKEYADGQKYFGLYLQQLQLRIKAVHDLTAPMIGDGLTKSDTDSTFWLAALMPKGIKLDMKDLKQQAAMPLSSYLRFDPWTDQVIRINAPQEILLNPTDKMPFEVTPIAIKLAYYKVLEPPPAPAPAAPAAAPTTAPPAAGTSAPAAGPTATAPAAAASAPAGAGAVVDTTAPPPPPSATPTAAPASLSVVNTSSPQPTTGVSSPPAVIDNTPAPAAPAQR